MDVNLSDNINWEGLTTARSSVSSGNTDRSCSFAERAEQLAATHPDDLSDEEFAELVGHTTVCLTCSAMLEEYRELGALLSNPPLLKGDFIECVPRLPQRIRDLIRSASNK